MWSGDMRTIPENCKKLVAQILHDNVTYIGGGDRAVCDWETACALFGNHQHLIDTAVKQLAWHSWFVFHADFNMQTTVVDSGGFYEACQRSFWENVHRWAVELPKDKYGDARGFC